MSKNFEIANRLAKDEEGAAAGRVNGSASASCLSPSLDTIGLVGGWVKHQMEALWTHFRRTEQGVDGCAGGRVPPANVLGQMSQWLNFNKKGRSRKAPQK